MLARIALLFLLAAPALAQNVGPYGKDADGATDHPLITRYSGSWLLAKDVSEFESIALPIGPQPAQVQTVEGKISRHYLLAPAGKSALEVQRNYEDALTKAGATRLYACAPPACATRDLSTYWKVRDPIWRGAQGSFSIDGYDWGITSVLENFAYGQDSQRAWVGRIGSPPNSAYVLVSTSDMGLTAGRGAAAQTLIIVVEPKAMVTGMVTVDAKALQSRLESDGKVALYGLTFDTGKATIKPESNAQLSEMAKLLKSQPAIKVFIVGHTDHQGEYQANLALSRQRAQAVVDALVKQHAIDASRMTAIGAANIAPVASNRTEDGRAKNRRVEMVLR